ncbi:alpha/beta fold hydrolase [Nocardioides humilatus]|uniref:Alpha/beta fold hydrolase n=1 Tax=Nocardioides humilatus TaxID=2607660 RepID=A0A5B1LGI9_9ACTN|nr:alpha/beta fold hydrolase [Nocardioides humilatus]KAA1418920.1 alpha/beta fold hydrolase [Nocardioides humilatus]
MRRSALGSLLLALTLVASGLTSNLASPPTASAVTSLERPPKGANDWTCRPSAEHPRPVVLVHGLGANMGMNWGYLSPRLKERGYCVFALTYGLHPLAVPFGAPGGTIKIEDSARELKTFIDRVLAATGSSQVDLVGHSEGTFMPQYYLKFLGGAPKVKRYVAYTPLYAGTKILGIPAIRDAGEKAGLAQPIINLISAFCGSCTQFLAGSPMQKKLAEGGAAAPGVEYTTVMSKYDELVIPYTSGYLPGQRNYVLQDLCPMDLSEHLAMAFDAVAAQIAFNALDPEHAQPITC